MAHKLAILMATHSSLSVTRNKVSWQKEAQSTFMKTKTRAISIARETSPLTWSHQICSQYSTVGSRLVASKKEQKAMHISHTSWCLVISAIDKLEVPKRLISHGWRHHRSTLELSHATEPRQPILTIRERSKPRKKPRLRYPRTQKTRFWSKGHVTRKSIASDKPSRLNFVTARIDKPSLNRLWSNSGTLVDNLITTLL